MSWQHIPFILAAVLAGAVFWLELWRKRASLARVYRLWADDRATRRAWQHRQRLLQIQRARL